MTAPIQQIVDTLAASIHAAQQESQPTPSQHQAIVDHITMTYPDVSLQMLMRRPHSVDVRELLAEDLTDANATSDSTLAHLTLSLARTIQVDVPSAAQVIGVDLTNVTAETLNISDVQITIQQSSGASDAEIETLRTTYLERCFSDTDQLLLTQITATGTLPARLSLKALYIPLLVKRVNWHEAVAKNRTSRANRVDLSQLDSTPVEYESALAQVDTHQYLVIVGGPGSGKSSFVKFLALSMAGELLGREDANVSKLTASLDQPLNEPLNEPIDVKHTSSQPNPAHCAWAHGGLLPIYIEVADFVAGGFVNLGSRPTADLLLKYLDTQLIAAELEQFEDALRQELRNQGGILLVDGLDEVTDAHDERKWIQLSVADFALSYPKVRILMTSRPYAFPERSEVLPRFHRAQLAPFTHEQIQRYIGHSYPLIYNQVGHKVEMAGQEQIWQNKHEEAEASYRASNKDSTIPRVLDLQAFVRQSAALSELAQTPLMLTLMVALFAWRKGALPERRETLYSEGVKLLLSVWEEPKQAAGQAKWEPPVQRGVQNREQDARQQIPHERIRQALEGLAYQYHAGQAKLEATAPIEENTLLAELARATAIHPVQVADYLRHRSGILVQHADGRYHFPHRTIQEYMAACHLHNSHEFPTNIINLVKQDPQRWRDVFLLASAKEARVRRYAVSALVNRLCPAELVDWNSRSGDFNHEQERGAFMAMLCGRLLIETGLATQPILDEEEERSTQLVRRLLVQVVDLGMLNVGDRLMASQALGSLGDMRSGIGIGEDELPHIEWQEVKAGSFLIGANQLTCNLIRKPYAISRYPITVAQYQAFVHADGYHQQTFWTHAGWAWRQEESISGPAHYSTFAASPNQPQVGISWYEAVAFCQWLSTKLAASITLPTEPEWERAARGTDGRNFPWGEEFSITDCNMRWTDIGYPSPVGIFPKNISPCGALDMAGNVWEWCSTTWQNSYDNYETAISNDINGTVRRVLRGGSWANRRRFVRCANRHRDHPNHRGPNVGFRVVRR